MPNLGGTELFILLLLIGVPIGTGYWCMRVFRRKGRSAGAGFALGFVLSLVLSLLGATIALIVSYTLTDTTQQAAGTEHAPTVVATFGPTTGWAGRSITYDGRGFAIEGVGTVSAQDVLTYDRQGHLAWAHDGMRAWVAQLAGPPALEDTQTAR